MSSNIHKLFTNCIIFIRCLQIKSAYFIFFFYGLFWNKCDSTRWFCMFLAWVSSRVKNTKFFLFQKNRLKKVLYSQQKCLSVFDWKLQWIVLFNNQPLSKQKIHFIINQKSSICTSLTSYFIQKRFVVFHFESKCQNFVVYSFELFTVWKVFKWPFIWEYFVVFSQYLKICDLQ